MEVTCESCANDYLNGGGCESQADPRNILSTECVNIILDCAHAYPCEHEGNIQLVYIKDIFRK